MIHEEICTYKVCKLAKEKGFPQGGIDPSKYWFDNYKGIVEEVKDNVFLYEIYPESRLARQITQSLLQRWLREEKGIHIEIIATASGYYWCISKTNGTSITDSDVLNRGTNEGGCFDTFEESLEDCEKYALENLV